ncbi:MAG: CsbD family protein [Janthinobacterium lividum]
MDENRIEGTAKDVGGKIQDAVGGLTGDTSTQARGKANQASGQAQDYYGQVMDEVMGFAKDQPVAALLSAAGVGLVLGYLLRRV